MVYRPFRKKYGSYIADGIFCNDRQAKNPSESDPYYGANLRLSKSTFPSLKCTQKADRYTVNEEIGNGLLSKPVGLITADEVAMAGAVMGYDKPNNSYYLYSGESYWTSSPSAFNAGDGDLYAFCALDNGALSNNIVYGGLNVRPVINLKADIQFENDGSFDTPYTIVME